MVIAVYCSECFWCMRWVPLPEVRQPMQLLCLWLQRSGPLLSVELNPVLSRSYSMSASGKWRKWFRLWELTCLETWSQRCDSKSHLLTMCQAHLSAWTSKVGRIQKLLEYSFGVIPTKTKSMCCLLSNSAAFYSAVLFILSCPAVTANDTMSKCHSSMLSAYLKLCQFKGHQNPASKV